MYFIKYHKTMAFDNLLRAISKAPLLLASLVPSQAWPRTIEEKNESPVKVAHSGNFSTVVTDSGREAFILFYSPRCIHCRTVEPVWEELGDKLQNEEIDVVKIDASSNIWPRNLYKLDGVPTFYWKYASDKKKPVKYNGGRDLEDFIRFVCKKATRELSGWDRKGRPKIDTE